MSATKRVTRSNPNTPASRSTLSQIKAQFRKKKRNTMDVPVKVHDPFAASIQAKDVVKGPTGLIYDDFMAEHKNPWDGEHVECPERILRAKARLDELGLTDKCQRIPSRKATNEEMLLCHTQEYLDELHSKFYSSGSPNSRSSSFAQVTRLTQDSENGKKITPLTTEEKKIQCTTKFHSVYMNDKSVECAEMAAGSAIQLTKSILDGDIQNGMALIRPPGHHASESEANGFCLLNNVAIATKYALKVHSEKVKKVLIVDLDVHHGQASQFFFYDDPNVLYFSIHRYDHGEFFPYLRESNYDYIGGPDDEPSSGKNVNVPLNKIGLSDQDYLSIFHQVLIPLTHEFNPDVILVSAGFDAAFGCPEGLMKVSPAAYGHLIHSLMAFAQGRIGIFLEGGYFVESVAEGVAMCVRALLGQVNLRLGPLASPDPSLVESVLNVISMQRTVWNCLPLQDDFSILEYDVMKELDCHVPALIYKGQQLAIENEVGEDYEHHEKATLDQLNQTFLNMRNKYELHLKRLALPSKNLALSYDEAMMEHASEEGPHPEQPLRIKEIYEKHREYGLLERVFHVSSRKATDEELLLGHDQKHLDNMKQMHELTQDEKNEMSDHLDSIYFNHASYPSALLAAGNVLSVVDAVCNEEAKCGVAIVRPPGHHAEPDEACGFCLFNNVGVAANYALENHSLKRVLILDWDVHHGNGIQNMFYNDSRVLYISIHRYDGGTFYPGRTDADHDFVGTGSGQGYNMNIAWNGSGMGDSEYALAFYGVILPVAYQFDPDLVLISSGFDAARGDPLGGCKISPEFYGHMTHQLKSLADGKVIVALEGGYNLNSISLSMTMVSKALLGDPMPQPAPYSKPAASAIAAVKATIKSHQGFWSCLKYGVKLPDDMSNIKNQMVKKVESFIADNEGSLDFDFDYIPEQFGAYASTFGVNTLCDIKKTNTRSELQSVDTNYKDNKGDQKKPEEDLAQNLQQLSLTKSEEPWIKSGEPWIPTILNDDPNVYIPSQFGQQSASSVSNTVSKSSSTPLKTDTTDSKKPSK